MITRKFKATVLKTGDTFVSIPVQVELAYDEENDPFAVQMILSAKNEEDVVWYVGRELMLAGISSPVPIGVGDVKFRFSGTANGLNSLYVCLSTKEGHADIGFPHDEVVAFLNDTTDAALEAIGHLDALIDEELEDMLNG